MQDCNRIPFSCFSWPKKRKKTNLLDHRETASQFMSTRERVLCLFLIYPAAICMMLSSNGNHTTPPCLEYRPCICQSPLQHTSSLLLEERGFKMKLTKKRHLKQFSLNFNAWYSQRLEMHWAYAFKKMQYKMHLIFKVLKKCTFFHTGKTSLMQRH